MAVDIPEDICTRCHGDRDWVDCPECGGEGSVSRYDEDPLWYDEDDLFRCETCQGRGGWYVCRACYPMAD